jgi:hypothetical protein
MLLKVLAGYFISDRVKLNGNKTNVSELWREEWHMALLPDIEAKYEDLFIQFLNQPAVFAKLQGEGK